jgi:hypothetical protein
MSGNPPSSASGNPVPHPASRLTDDAAAAPGTGSAEPGTAGTPRRRRAAAAAAPVTGKPHKPCSHPPKSRPAAYDRRPAAGPGRTPRRAQRRSEETRQVRVELPEEPPQLTPEAALALLRVLLQARATRRGEDGDQPVTDDPARSATGQERKG